jgi:hypothetical protein
MFEQLSGKPSFYAIKEVIFFAPCEIVAGDVTFWDIPGKWDRCDFLTCVQGVKTATPFERISCGEP